MLYVFLFICGTGLNHIGAHPHSDYASLIRGRNLDIVAYATKLTTAVELNLSLSPLVRSYRLLRKLYPCAATRCSIIYKCQRCIGGILESHLLNCY